MVCNDIKIYERHPDEFGFVCLRKTDNYKSIWLSLSGVNIEQPICVVKINGDRQFDVDFFKHLINSISHESIHAVMIKLENLDTSKSYNKLYHYKRKWWLP
jgi:hypothetical protein